MSVIVSDNYRNNERRLMFEKIVIDMAHGLRDVDVSDITHEDGTPRFNFMQSANAEYHSRGGKDNESIGAVATVLLRLLKGEG